MAGGRYQRPEQCGADNLLTDINGQLEYGANFKLQR